MPSAPARPSTPPSPPCKNPTALLQIPPCFPPTGFFAPALNIQARRHRRLRHPSRVRAALYAARPHGIATNDYIQTLATRPRIPSPTPAPLRKIRFGKTSKGSDGAKPCEEPRAPPKHPLTSGRKPPWISPKKSTFFQFCQLNPVQSSLFSTFAYLTPAKVHLFPVLPA